LKSVVIREWRSCWVSLNVSIDRTMSPNERSHEH
jgi:hypothetical protein